MPHSYKVGYGEDWKAVGIQEQALASKVHKDELHLLYQVPRRRRTTFELGRDRQCIRGDPEDQDTKEKEVPQENDEENMSKNLNDESFTSDKTSQPEMTSLAHYALCHILRRTGLVPSWQHLNLHVEVKQMHYLIYLQLMLPLFLRVQRSRMG